MVENCYSILAYVCVCVRERERERERVFTNETSFQLTKVILLLSLSAWFLCLF